MNMLYGRVITLITAYYFVVGVACGLLIGEMIG